jgi:hypothetical protein
MTPRPFTSADWKRWPDFVRFADGSAPLIVKTKSRVTVLDANGIYIREKSLGYFACYGMTGVFDQVEMAYLSQCPNSLLEHIGFESLC